MNVDANPGFGGKGSGKVAWLKNRPGHAMAVLPGREWTLKCVYTAAAAIITERCLRVPHARVCEPGVSRPFLAHRCTKFDFVLRARRPITTRQQALQACEETQL
mmetsp:Transcript_74486/g.136091  ORF Transcript_74486/g.136091 Transcript_74486/m.136091 type:complete len:104 (+) Transcript_74486:151-462(+)